MGHQEEHPNVYGYVRVSSREQNEDRQLFAMEEFQIPEKNLIVEKVSGKDFDRPKYKELVGRLRKGDVLIIKSIDRLGRNYDAILEQWRILTKQIGVWIVVMDMPLLNTRDSKDLTGTLIADIVLQLLSYVAERERADIRERQAEGIAAAKRRGVKCGRPQKSLQGSLIQVCQEWQDREITAAEAGKLLGISRQTFLRRVRERDLTQG